MFHKNQRKAATWQHLPQKKKKKKKRESCYKMHVYYLGLDAIELIPLTFCCNLIPILSR